MREERTFKKFSRWHNAPNNNMTVNTNNNEKGKRTGAANPACGNVLKKIINLF